MTNRRKPVRAGGANTPKPTVAAEAAPAITITTAPAPVVEPVVTLPPVEETAVQTVAPPADEQPAASLPEAEVAPVVQSVPDVSLSTAFATVDQAGMPADQANVPADQATANADRVTTLQASLSTQAELVAPASEGTTIISPEASSEIPPIEAQPPAMVDARVLMEFDGVAVNTILTAPDIEIERLYQAGLVDPHPDAVAAVRDGLV